jgi:hypothetical protein
MMMLTEMRLTEMRKLKFTKSLGGGGGSRPRRNTNTCVCSARTWLNEKWDILCGYYG